MTFKNFAVSTVATAPSPATSGTSLVVASGHGTRFPAVPFAATVWPASSQPDPSNAEVVLVTVVSTDTFTIARAQEGSSARTVVVGDQIAATITAKALNEVDYVERTTALTVTATTDAGAQAFITGNAVTYDGSTRVKIEVYVPWASVAVSSAAVLNLYDGSTDLGRVFLLEPGITDVTVNAARFLTPSAGSHTYSIRAWKSGTVSLQAGAGGTATYMPAWYRITVA